MRQATDLRALAHRRATLLQTAADTMAGKYDRPTVSASSRTAETDETLSLAAIHAAVAIWPDDLRESWDERAAIIQYCGGETRETAERRAFDCYSAEAAERNGAP